MKLFYDIHRRDTFGKGHCFFFVVADVTAYYIRAFARDMSPIFCTYTCATSQRRVKKGEGPTEREPFPWASREEGEEGRGWGYMCGLGWSLHLNFATWLVKLLWPSLSYLWSRVPPPPPPPRSRPNIGDTLPSSGIHVTSRTVNSRMSSVVEDDLILESKLHWGRLHRF